MQTLRKVAVCVAAIYSIVALFVHLAALVKGPALFPDSFQFAQFCVSMAVAVFALVITAPPRGKEPLIPPWHVQALIAIALFTALWPKFVGSGLPGEAYSFGKVGVASGEPGDRHLLYKGRHVRDLTEDEYQSVRYWRAIHETGFMAGFAGMTLAGALTFAKMRKEAPT